MALHELVNELFVKADAIAEKPSFTGSDITISDGNCTATVYAKAERRVSISPQLCKRPQFLSASGVINSGSSIAGSTFSILYPVEGYHVGRMTRQDCQCGAEPIWIYANQTSTEPGRTDKLIFDELGLSNDPRSCITSLVRACAFRGIRLEENLHNGAKKRYEIVALGKKYMATFSTVPLQPNSQFRTHRRFDISAVLSPGEAERISKKFVEYMARTPDYVGLQMNGDELQWVRASGLQRQGMIVYEDKGIKPGTVLQSVPVGDQFYVTLRSLVVEVNPTTERKNAVKLVASVFP